jgi:hypothetical protein
MTDRYRALTGLRYPKGNAEHAKAEAGEPYEEVTVAPGDECLNLCDDCPICGGDVQAYLSMNRPVIELIAAKPKAVKS